MKHGCSSKVTTEYRAWNNMRQRCNNPRHPNFHCYGGRGISICDRWDEFSNFLEDMGKRPEGLTLERVDNNGDYCPENCKWVTRKDQQKNRRCTVLFEGKTTTDLMAETGMAPNSLRRRILNKWDALKPVGFFRRGGSKVTESQVREVRVLAVIYGPKKGFKAKIAREMGLPTDTVEGILSGQRFSKIV